MHRGVREPFVNFRGSPPPTMPPEDWSLTAIPRLVPGRCNPHDGLAKSARKAYPRDGFGTYLTCDHQEGPASYVAMVAMPTRTSPSGRTTVGPVVNGWPSMSPSTSNSSAIQQILRHREHIWLTRPRDICAYIESLPAGIVPGS